MVLQPWSVAQQGSLHLSFSYRCCWGQPYPSASIRSSTTLPFGQAWLDTYCSSFYRSFRVHELNRRSFTVLRELASPSCSTASISISDTGTTLHPEQSMTRTTIRSLPTTSARSSNTEQQKTAPTWCRFHLKIILSLL